MNQSLDKEINNFLYKNYSQILKIEDIKIIHKENIKYLILQNIAQNTQKKLQNELKLLMLQKFPEIDLRIIFSNPKTPNNSEKIRLAKKIILVTSCKGGVGKSTISSLIAQKLAYNNPDKKIALLDADIYGPSIQQIFDISSKPQIVDNKMIPILKYDVFINSIGMIIESDQALTIRAPIANKTLFKLFSLTDWNNPDFLIIDTPPGTGDIHLSILQNYVIDHVILITTPQKLSQIDATRTIKLYEKFNLSITSVIENMSYLEVNNSKKKIFYGDAADWLRNHFSIFNMEKIAILPELSQFCDQGQKLANFFSKIDINYL